MNFNDFSQQEANALPEGEAFAVVQLKQNNKQFTKWHPTLVSAMQEAERLAGINNQPYAVIQLVGVMEPAARPVKWKPAANAR